MVKYNPAEGLNSTIIEAKYNISDDLPTVTAFLYDQTIYVHSLTKYSETPTTMQTQLGIKTGIKLWGQKDIEAIIKEMKIFHNREVLHLIIPSEVIPQIKNISPRISHVP